MFKKSGIATLVLFVAVVYLNNTSFLADPVGSDPALVTHRALGQQFSREGLTNQTCTAAQMIPVNYAPWLWGWPNRFLQRMKTVGSRVVVIGNYHGEGFSQGIDAPELLDELPADFSGGIWTDRIDLIGPAVENDAYFVQSDSAEH